MCRGEQDWVLRSMRRGAHDLKKWVRSRGAQHPYMTFYFAQYGTNPTLGSNGLYWAKFIADQCTTWQDIPNKFSSGDVVTVDCNTADITLNDAPTPELGALGNDYEQFYLSPGVNQIGCVWSEWASRNPTFRMRYREVYL